MSDTPPDTVESSTPPEATAAPAPESADGAAVPAVVTPDLAAPGGLLVDDLRIELEQFEGPFEVLLYLIRAQEIDIFDIPISQVTAQYLGFLDLMKNESLDVASEFIVMAATLIQIKSRMILPVEVEEEDDEPIEEEDPRLELVEKLLEYRRFRDYSEALDARWEIATNRYARNVKPRVDYDDEDEDDELLEVSLSDLIRAIRAMLRYVLAPPVHEVVAEGSSVDEKIGRIETMLDDKETVTWLDLLAECRSKVEVVCCLLAILELCRMRRIRFHQHQTYGDIRLFARDPDDAGQPDAAETADPDVVEA